MIRSCHSPPCHPHRHLAHEVGNDPVEGGTLEAEALLASAQRAKVLAGPRHHVFPKLNKEIRLQTAIKIYAAANRYLPP